MGRQLTRLTVVVAVAGCAGSQGSGTSQPAPIIATTEKGPIQTYGQKPSETVDLSASPTNVIKALDASYRQLGIEVKLNNPATGEVGNRRFEKMHRLGNVPLSEYFGCGDTLMGPAADSYSLTISLVSQVTPNGSGSGVRTTAAARAQNMTSSNGAVACESRGTLEKKLADTLREILRSGAP